MLENDNYETCVPSFRNTSILLFWNSRVWLLRPSSHNYVSPSPISEKLPTLLTRMEVASSDLWSWGRLRLQQCIQFHPLVGVCRESLALVVAFLVPATLSSTRVVSRRSRTERIWSSVAGSRLGGRVQTRVSRGQEVELLGRELLVRAAFEICLSRVMLFASKNSYPHKLKWLLSAMGIVEEFPLSASAKDV